MLNARPCGTAIIAILSLLAALPVCASETACLGLSLTMLLILRNRRRKAVRRIVASGFSRRLVWKAAYRFGRNLSAMLKNRVHDCVSEREVVIHGEDQISALAQGGVAVGYHFGPWELLPGILARRGLRMGVVTNFYAARPIDQFLRRFRARDRVELFYANGPENEVRRMIEFIRSGGTVGALIDGDTFDQKYPVLKRIIDRFGFRVVPVFGYLKHGKMHVFVGHPLTDALRYSPENYFWFYASHESMLQAES